MQPLIYLLRHGAVDTACPRRFLGQGDPPLNAIGIGQAKQVGHALAHLTFAHVFASPLERAMHTAMLVSGRPRAAIAPVAAFREISLGTWEGLSVAELQQQFPGAHDERGQRLNTYRPPGGESFADVAARALPALHQIANTARRPVLIVAHAGVNRALLVRLQHLPPDDLFHLPQDYCGVNVLAWNKGRFEVLAINRQYG